MACESYDFKLLDFFHSQLCYWTVFKPKVTRKEFYLSVLTVTKTV